MWYIMYTVWCPSHVLLLSVLSWHDDQSVSSVLKATVTVHIWVVINKWFWFWFWNWWRRWNGIFADGLWYWRLYFSMCITATCVCVCVAASTFRSGSQNMSHVLNWNCCQQHTDTCCQVTCSRSVSFHLSLSLSLFSLTHTHTYTHTGMHTLFLLILWPL